MLPLFDNDTFMRESKSATGAKTMLNRDRPKDWQPIIKMESAGDRPSERMVDVMDSKTTSGRKILTGSSFYKTARDKSGNLGAFSPTKDIRDLADQKLDSPGSPRELQNLLKTKDVSEILDELEVCCSHLDDQA